MKQALQDDVNSILSGSPTAIPDPPPLAVEPADDVWASTSLAPDTARTNFLMQAARSIVSDSQVPWKLAELTDPESAQLFDSRSLFELNGPTQYAVIHLDHGEGTPGDPNAVYAFLRSNDLVGTSRIDTINRVHWKGKCYPASERGNCLPAFAPFAAPGTPPS